MSLKLDLDNYFQNMACICANFEEFVEELAEWGVDHAAGIDFDDPELDIPTLDRFIKAENGNSVVKGSEGDQRLSLSVHALTQW